MNGSRTIELREYEPRLIGKGDITPEEGELIWKKCERRVTVDFPSPTTGWQWQLTSNGWVGHIPVSNEIHLSLQPKTSIHNIFRMLEYAYGLQSFHFLQGLADLESLEDVFEELALLLSRRVATRAKKGLYRNYIRETEDLSFIRGRMDVDRLATRPWSVRPRCTYDLHTADLDENQILSWTLHRLTRTTMRRDPVRRSVRRAYTALRGHAAPMPFSASDCVGRRYTRLNSDYEVLHALCRFFLEHTGPNVNEGEHGMLPFVVDMAALFESFVAAWMKEHLPQHLSFRPQEHYNFESGTYFRIDLVVYQRLSDGLLGPSVCVLDTKYKVPASPAPSDIAQVIAYAVAKGCSDAFLVYPYPLPTKFDEQIGDIRVRSLTYDLGLDVLEAGPRFLEGLLSGVSTMTDL